MRFDAALGWRQAPAVAALWPRLGRAVVPVHPPQWCGCQHRQAVNEYWIAGGPGGEEAGQVPQKEEKSMPVAERTLSSSQVLRSAFAL